MADVLTYPINSLPETGLDSPQSVEQEDIARREQLQARLLSRQKEQSKNALQSNFGREVRGKVVKEVERQTLRIALRVLNLGGAASVVGIFLPLVIMNIQLFLFNLLMPNTPIGKLLKLAWWEVAFIVIIDFLAIFAFIILLMVAIGMSPTFWLSALADALWSGFKQQVCNIIPSSCKSFGL